MRTNIITGAFGFIGSHLARYLAEHYPDERLVLIDHAKAMTPERIRYLPYALAKAEVIPLHEGENVNWDEFNNKNTVLYHMGAVSSTQASMEDMVQDNFDVVQDIAKEFAGSIVFASSMSVYGNTQNPKNPEGYISPETAYAMSKRSAELVFANRHSWRKKPYTLIARFANVFGRNEDHKLEYAPTFGGTQKTNDMRSLPNRVLVDTLRERTPDQQRDIEVYQPGKEYARDFVYVKRAVEALVAAERTLCLHKLLRVVEIGRGEAMQWDRLALEIAGAYSCLSHDHKLGGCTDLNVLKLPAVPAFLTSPGYQRYTRACSSRLLENTSTIQEDILDMFREERPDTCHSWGTNYGPAIRSRLTTSGDHDILKQFT